MEVDDRGAGGAPVTPIEDQARTRLNIVLWVAVIVCAAVVIFLCSRMWATQSDAEGGFWHRVGWVLTDHHEPAVDVGRDVGSGVVEPLPEAPEADQKRIADVLETSTKFVTTFLNVDWKTADDTYAAVRSMGTGAFQKQWDKVVKKLALLVQRAHSVEKAEVVWAGYVGGDKSSATVIVMAQGTVSSTASKGKPLARYFRLRVNLQQVDGRWLANDLRILKDDGTEGGVGS